MIGRVRGCLSALPEVRPVEAWGETSFFVNPGGRLRRGTYFATVKEKDGDNDRASGLDRDGVWRLNLGLPKDDFRARFGTPPVRPAKGGVVEGEWDFRALDVLTPHPVYGWMSWAAVLCPSAAIWDDLLASVNAAHVHALSKAQKRISVEV